MEPATSPEKSGHLSLTEARARVAERLAGVTRNRIAGKVRDEDIAEVERSLSDLSQMIESTEKELARARTSGQDADALLSFLREDRAEDIQQITERT